MTAEWLSLREAIAMLSVSKQRVSFLLKTGRLIGHKLHGRWLIDQDSVAMYIIDRPPARHGCAHKDHKVMHPNQCPACTAPHRRERRTQ